MQNSVEKNLTLSNDLIQPSINDQEGDFLELLSNHIKGLGFDSCRQKLSSAVNDLHEPFTTLDYIFNTTDLESDHEHPSNNIYKDCQLDVSFMLTPKGYLMRDMKLSHSVIEDFTLWCNFDESDLATSLKRACFFSCDVYEVSLADQLINRRLSTIEDITQAFLRFFDMVLKEYHEQIKIRLKHLTLIQNLEARCYYKSTSVKRSDRITSYEDTYSLPDNKTVIVSTSWQGDYISNRRNYLSLSPSRIHIDRDNFLSLFSTWTTETK